MANITSTTADTLESMALAKYGPTMLRKWEAKHMDRLTMIFLTKVPMAYVHKNSPARSDSADEYVRQYYRHLMLEDASGAAEENTFPSISTVLGTDVINTTVQCYRCQSYDVHYFYRMLRSGDEPMSMVCTCRQCQNTWVSH